MKIKFIGVGSAFTTAEYYQSNMLITAKSGKRLLFDCGSDTRFSLTESIGANPLKQIDAIYISHLHADHIGGMEWVAFNTYFDPHIKKPKLFMNKKTMHKMWHHALKGGLACVNGKVMHLTDFFDCQPITEGGTFIWENMSFTLIKMPHVMGKWYNNHYSYGLLFQEMVTNSSSPDDETPIILITSDTLFRPKLIARLAQKATIIFHDCETSPFKTKVHAHYEELCTLPVEIAQKMWLYHYQPHPPQQPENDQFKGFVVKGQEFDFTI